MEQSVANEKTSSIEMYNTKFMKDSDINLAKQHLHLSRIIQSIAIFAGIPIIFIAWIFASRQFGLDVIFTSRAAMLTITPVITTTLFIPLLLKYPKEIRWRGYVLQWFSIALFFNVVWQIPPVVFQPLVQAAEYTQNNLPYYIFYWGYYTSDLDYANATRFWILAEVSWWAISLLVIVGLVKFWRGNEKHAFILFGVCGALQLYNVGFFISYGGIVEQFNNIAADSIMALFIYWIYNLLWGIAAVIASIISFKYIFLIYIKKDISETSE